MLIADTQPPGDRQPFRRSEAAGGKEAISLLATLTSTPSATKTLTSRPMRTTSRRSSRSLRPTRPGSNAGSAGGPTGGCSSARSIRCGTPPASPSSRRSSSATSALPTSPSPLLRSARRRSCSGVWSAHSGQERIPLPLWLYRHLAGRTPLEPTRLGGGSDLTGVIAP